MRPPTPSKSSNSAPTPSKTSTTSFTTEPAPQILSRSVTNVFPGDVPLNGAWDGASNLRIADGVPIDSGVVHTYEVVVRAAGDSSQLTDTAADCNLDSGETGTGLLNTATVTANGVALSADACEPIRPRSLPITGAALVVWAVVGLALIAGGNAAMLVVRRRRQHSVT